MTMNDNDRMLAASSGRIPVPSQREPRVFRCPICGLTEEVERRPPRGWISLQQRSGDSDAPYIRGPLVCSWDCFTEYVQRVVRGLGSTKWIP